MIFLGFSLDKYQEIELLDYRVILFLIFRGTSILFSVVAAPIYMPANSVSMFLFFCILANTCYLLCSVDNNHSVGVR